MHKDKKLIIKVKDKKIKDKKKRKSERDNVGTHHALFS